MSVRLKTTKRTAGDQWRDYRRGLVAYRWNVF
jgi:hypothetical protein